MTEEHEKNLDGEAKNSNLHVFNCCWQFHRSTFSLLLLPSDSYLLPSSSLSLFPEIAPLAVCPSPHHHCTAKRQPRRHSRLTLSPSVHPSSSSSSSSSSSALPKAASFHVTKERSLEPANGSLSRISALSPKKRGTRIVNSSLEMRSN